MIVTACLVGYDTLNAVGERLLADQIFNAVLPADPLRSKAASKSRSAANPQNFFGRYPQSGLTAPNGDIRSASSIGTVVCSSAVVVGQRSERSVP
jgi:hypothetical protein